jgi:S-adenosyl methyltransferase/HD domain
VTGSRANFRTGGKVKDIMATPAECWPVEPVLFDTSTPNIARVYDYWLGGKDNYALLEAAAWLHDIGYLPELAGTGLHALDGARYLRDVQHALPMLCRLVAHHSCAVIEAEERDLADALRREFEPPPPAARRRAHLLRHDHHPRWRANER